MLLLYPFGTTFVCVYANDVCTELHLQQNFNCNPCTLALSYDLYYTVHLYIYKLLCIHFKIGQVSVHIYAFQSKRNKSIIETNEFHVHSWYLENKQQTTQLTTKLNTVFYLTL